MKHEETKKSEKPAMSPQDKIKEPPTTNSEVETPAHEGHNQSPSQAKSKKHPARQGYHGSDDERTLNPEE